MPNKNGILYQTTLLPDEHGDIMRAIEERKREMFPGVDFPNEHSTVKNSAVLRAIFHEWMEMTYILEERPELLEQAQTRHGDTVQLDGLAEQITTAVMAKLGQRLDKIESAIASGVIPADQMPNIISGIVPPDAVDDFFDMGALEDMMNRIDFD